VGRVSSSLICTGSWPASLATKRDVEHQSIKVRAVEIAGGGANGPQLAVGLGRATANTDGERPSAVGAAVTA
jgi:hypothetical protein